MRNHPTSAEDILWSKLKNSQLGVKFRRQHSVDYYILDFYCPSHKLAIELDGSSHDEKQDYDNYRTKYLSEFNIKIMRFWNSQIVNKLDWVIEKIKENIPSLIRRGL